MFILISDVFILISDSCVSKQMKNPSAFDHQNAGTSEFSMVQNVKLSGFLHTKTRPSSDLQTTDLLVRKSNNRTHALSKMKLFYESIFQPEGPESVLRIQLMPL